MRAFFAVLMMILFLTSLGWATVPTGGVVQEGSPYDGPTTAAAPPDDAWATAQGPQGPSAGQAEEGPSMAPTPGTVPAPPCENVPAEKPCDEWRGTAPGIAVDAPAAKPAAPTPSPTVIYRGSPRAGSRGGRGPMGPQGPAGVVTLDSPGPVVVREDAEEKGQFNLDIPLSQGANRLRTFVDGEYIFVSEDGKPDTGKVAKVLWAFSNHVYARALEPVKVGTLFPGKVLVTKTGKPWMGETVPEAAPSGEAQPDPADVKKFRDTVTEGLNQRVTALEEMQYYLLGVSLLALVFSALAVLLHIKRRKGPIAERLSATPDGTETSAPALGKRVSHLEAVLFGSEVPKTVPAAQAAIRRELGFKLTPDKLADLLVQEKPAKVIVDVATAPCQKILDGINQLLEERLPAAPATPAPSPEPSTPAETTSADPTAEG